MAWSPLLSSLLLLCAVWLTLSGCTVHSVSPQPSPDIALPTAYSHSPATAAAARKAWWLAFGDDKLSGLIDSGLAANVELRAALTRLAQAAALSRQAGVAGRPQVSLSAGSRQRFEEGASRDHSTALGLEFSWEIDAFNRLGAIAMATRSREQARSDDVEALRLRLSADIASAYFDGVGWRRQLALLHQQAATDRELLELTRLRFSSGLTASIDVLQQSSQLAETESLMPPVEAGLRLAENRLDVLLGVAPDGKDRTAPSDTLAVVAELPALGIPADLLLNRPDLRALQSELVAADAEIGRAIAERLPRISLSGSTAYESGSDLNGLVASLLGTFIQPLLDWGARKAEVERNQALYVERLAQFSQRYLEAIEEVENSLYRERKQWEFLDRLRQRLDLLEQTVTEATDRYTNGLTDYLPVLDSVKELQRLQRIFVQQERTLLDLRIDLHRALGGALPARQPLPTMDRP